MVHQHTCQQNTIINKQNLKNNFQVHIFKNEVATSKTLAETRGKSEHQRMNGSELTANAEVNGWSPSPTQGQTTEEWLFTEYTEMVTHLLDFTLNLEGTYKSNHTFENKELRDFCFTIHMILFPYS